jgi:hypothetical protein
MENGGDNIGCICTVCQTKGGGRIPSIAAGSIAKRKYPQENLVYCTSLPIISNSQC